MLSKNFRGKTFLNLELQFTMMNLKTDFIFNETLKLHMVNLGIKIDTEVFI